MPKLTLREPEIQLSGVQTMIVLGAVVQLRTASIDNLSFSQLPTIDVNPCVLFKRELREIISKHSKAIIKHQLKR